MNRKELLKEIRVRARITNVETEAFFDAFKEVITNELIKNGEVKISGFGKFRLIDLKPRLVKLPGSKAEIQTGKRKAVRFSAWKPFQAVINGN
ncbi:MAG: hypothetical protein Kow0029_18550 [Candidatus Rifleibacteriota bacterium]